MPNIPCALGFRTYYGSLYYPMLDNVLIPHDAIQAFAHGRKQPKRLRRVQPLFTLKEASGILGMSAKEVGALLKSGEIFGVVRKQIL